MHYFDVFDAFSPWTRRPSVYVISDSDMKAYKAKQAAAEVTDLKQLIEHHRTSAERLEAQVLKLEAEYPQLTPSE